MNKSNLLHLNLISRHEAHTATAMATHGACSLGSYTDQLLPFLSLGKIYQQSHLYSVLGDYYNLFKGFLLTFSRRMIMLWFIPFI